MNRIIALKEINRYPIGLWDRHFEPKPVFDDQAYQEKLNAIAGFYNNMPILKLEWGGDTKVKKFNQWDEVGLPIEEIILPKYALKRPMIVDPTLIEYIPIRRWVIAQYQSPGQYNFGDDSDNTFTDERGINCLIDSKSSEGRYEPLIYVGDHLLCPSNCCEHKICLGAYKDPSEAELEWIRWATQQLAKEFKQDPDKPVSEELINKHRRDAQYKADKIREEKDEDLDYYWKDWHKTHGHRLTTEDPSVLKHGKYKFFKDGKPI